MEAENLIPFPSDVAVSTKERFGRFSPKSILQKRMISFAVDITVIAFIKFIVTVSYASFVKTFFYQLNLESQINMVQGLSALDTFNTLLIFASYFTFSHFWGDGKTIGKLITRTTVVNSKFIHEYDHQHTDLNFRLSMLRMIGYLSSYVMLGLPFVFAFFRKDGRSWPDFISRSQTLDDDDIQKLHMLKLGDESDQQLDLEADILKSA